MEGLGILANRSDEQKPKKYEAYSHLIQPSRIEKWLANASGNSNTRDAYLGGLMALLAHMERSGLRFEGMQRGDLLRFKTELLDAGHEPSTVSLYLAGIRSFFRFAEDQSWYDDVAAGVKGEKHRRAHKRDTLTRDQAKALLRSIKGDETLQGLRDYAMVNLMLRTGLRDIEVSRAQLADLNPEAPGTDRAILKIQGKGRTEKDDFVVLEEAVMEPIRAYLTARRKVQGLDSDDDDAPLFSSLSRRNRGEALTPRSISRIVKGRLDAVGLTGPYFTAHSLRHTAVTFSLLAGASVQEAQAMARHADISTTLIYAHNVNRLKNAAETKVSDYLDDE